MDIRFKVSKECGRRVSSGALRCIGRTPAATRSRGAARSTHGAADGSALARGFKWSIPDPVRSSLSSLSWSVTHSENAYSRHLIAEDVDIP